MAIHKRFGQGTTLRREVGTVLQRARAAGLAGDVETLQMLVQAWRCGYEKLIATTPAGSQARAMIEGAMASTENLSRQYMDAV